MIKRQGSRERGLDFAAPIKKTKRLRFEVASILTFSFGVFLAIALWTYQAQDPSFLNNTNSLAKNACGVVGAHMAAVLLYGLGLGAFLVPSALMFLSVTLHQREGFVRFMGILGGMTVAVMAMAVFISLQWKTITYNNTLILTGGTFGVWVAQILTKPLNYFGASLVSMVVFCIAIVLSTPISIAQFFGTGSKFLSKWTWRCAKVFGTYFAYLVGILAVRTAHGTGNILQRMMIAAKKAQQKKPKEIPSTVSDAIAVNASFSSIPEEETNISPWKPADETIEEPHFATAAAESASAHGDHVPDILPFPRAPAGVDEVSNLAPKAKKIPRASKAPGHWKLPTPEFLVKPPKIESQFDRDQLIENSHILKQKLADFGIDGEITAVRPGPVITLYEFKPGPGVKVSKIAALADDLSMALSAESVRIVAPLPGKSVVGIEIPSEHREMVYLREFLQHSDFLSEKFSIPVIMGKDIAGHPVISDLARMPHLLCAGQTGSGKSVFMNGLICSLLYRFTPSELRMILVDPKFIEFRAYQDIPHLLLPVVDDPKNASTALKWAVREMERRYRILAMMGVRNLDSYNQKVEEMGSDVVHDLLFSEENQELAASGTISGGDWIEAFETDEKGSPRIDKLPFVVVIIDELADLMMVAKKDVEISIARIAQKARAAGIHLVIATQRPSTDVITGLIKANLPSRASFQLASYIDSKTILDRAGAERLLGQGDMLFIPPGSSNSLRVHAAYVNDGEIDKISSFLRSQGAPEYRDEILIDDEEDMSGEGSEEDDDLFQDAVGLVRKTRQASASYLQRHLKVGYNRAARMIETMESRGIVGPADGARPREVLIP